ncbi:hypothetical protein [Allorhodopirellula heiligendammensis]|uniref:Uncharacterized protein n=1 Tax=Allorhodopirellula heiligendammensis TaxID=2714739 RepID=A0A5C6BEP5_9BACT|nr:hypothetical protein [Allorhodopirellula heiligendammensis]TWU09766.1 hypothetical protein Poly21_55110 [Allorhodopirellula heiligendammensis]|tara:strand:+ start:342 stop:812 length:471 start_codon:yes stop_codon:yes gene_type:complete
MDSVLNAPLEQLAALARANALVQSNEQSSAADSPNTLIPAAEALELLQQEVNRIQRLMRLTLQSKLQDLVGRSLGSLEHNRALAGAIQSMLDQHGFRIRCHQCGHPAILRLSPRKGIPTGAFVFDHSINGRRTFHGGTAAVPPIHLVAKPGRKRKA